ncbi:dTDP-4-dehydrorhamnose reductase [Lysobacter niastensis]|uniref:dTDP-4-dehydrorhamnose reductase n=1 Tax=Lysobacter niastensis TaxID=380629 RepID=A0ABU1W8R1_9GAMM|nr:dTDP-4-dehydrorhamnose reductase [Lysobacter niastensis]MDR7133839.1 dTDP-4-dehydrorhamnose reductase [Lysobacter niastensis]
MKLLLLGANGQVGHELRRSLAPLGEVVATTRSGLLDEGIACERFDLADLDAIGHLIERVHPDVVVNAAAYTAVDKAEDEAVAAFLTNAQGPGRLAEACAARGIDLVHYSTDYVFDGQGTRPYREDDPTAPLGVYGESKLAGEQAIVASGVRHLILRTAWVYGLYGQNFLRTMLRVGAERDELRVVADQRGCPTPAWLIADVTAKVLQQGIATPGVRHLVTAGETSWHGFAEAIFDEAVANGALTRRPVVHAITTADYPTRAQRPAYSVLDCRRLCDEFAISLPDWRSALSATLAGQA